MLKDHSVLSRVLIMKLLFLAWTVLGLNCRASFRWIKLLLQHRAWKRHSYYFKGRRCEACLHLGRRTLKGTDLYYERLADAFKEAANIFSLLKWGRPENRHRILPVKQRGGVDCYLCCSLRCHQIPLSGLNYIGLMPAATPPRVLERDAKPHSFKVTMKM